MLFKNGSQTGLGDMKPGEVIREERKKRRWSQKELADRVGVSQVAIMKIENGTTDKSKFFPKIAQVLGIELTKLDTTLSRNVDMSPARQNLVAATRKPQIYHVDQLVAGYDLPVFSTREGGAGVNVLSKQAFRTISRPHNLVGIEDAFGVLIVGNKMALEYREGDIAYVDPHTPPRIGDACMFRADRGGTVEVRIKYMDEPPPNPSPEIWYVRQSNPPRKFTLKKADWPTCYVLVGKQSGR